MHGNAVRLRTMRLQRYPGVIDYEIAVSFPAAYRVGLFHCADILIHAPSQEVRWWLWRCWGTIPWLHIHRRLPVRWEVIDAPLPLDCRA